MGTPESSHLALYEIQYSARRPGANWISRGREIPETGFAILDPHLSRHDHAAGDQFTIAHAALFCAERWAAPNGVTLPVNFQAHFERMLARPAVHKVRQLRGEEA